MKLTQWFETPHPDGSPKSKAVFAKDIGVTPQMISAYCDGRTVPSKERVKLIYDKTDQLVTPNDWYDLKEGVG
jgi:hypothetical protein